MATIVHARRFWQRPSWRTLLALCAFLAPIGCVHRIWNSPLNDHGAPDPYDFSTRMPKNAEDVFVVLAFSGGGTRSAAFAYGVLEKLRDTTIGLHGQQRRLLDEIDVITAVSGGSYPAAYYGLFGERIFTEFEPRFLNRNLQRELLQLLSHPRKLLSIMRADLDRADVAAKYIDRKLFAGRTFAEMSRGSLPFIIINASDLNNATTFSFIQPQFDFLCSDLSTFPVANAVMASSAVPGVFGTVALRNYPGCTQRDVAWVKESIDQDDFLDRRYVVARALARYADPQRLPIIRLVDGGVTDNLGVRGSMMSPIAQRGNVMDMAGAFSAAQLGHVRHVLVIVANAQVYREFAWSRSGRDPGTMANVSASFDAALGILNTETASLARQGFQMWEQHVNQLRPPSQPRVTVHFAILTFNQIRNTAERARFDALPTSLNLNTEQSRAVRSLAGNLLDESPEFQSFLRALRDELNP